jgi:hypothetical protein
MKLLSTATLAATLLSYVAADVSRVELHQRALKAFSGRKSHAFSRELELSDECLTNQAELESNPDLAVMDDLTDEQLAKCDMEIKGESASIECDFDDMGISIDSACASAGGSVVKVDFEMDCADAGLYTNYLNAPACLHDTCDAKEYMEYQNDNADLAEDLLGCDMDYDFSGAVIGSTSIISIALVSLFAMLW